MDELISKFYLFKGILEEKKIIKSQREYVFTLDPDEHDGENSDRNNSTNKNEESIFEEKKEINDEKIIGNILSYLPLKESLGFINASKFGFNCFK